MNHDLVEDTEEQQTISFLQTTLSIAQKRLNEMMAKSINDEAKFQQTIINLQKENENLKNKERPTDGNGKSQIATN